MDRARRDLSVDLFGMRRPTLLFLCPIEVIGTCAQGHRGDLARAAATGEPMPTF